jgi:iron complex transport system ATP-binding protein
MTVPVVELHEVGSERGGKRILDSVSWTIERGQHWALVGANGSGKTTLLKILTGYEWATTGTVRVLGRLFGEHDLRKLRLTIGWVSNALEYFIPGRDTALEVTLSGLDASFGVYRDFSEAERAAAADALGHLKAGYVAGQPFETLSQGEQKRTLIARALVCKPALLILDEPCAGLDPVARDAFLGDLADMARTEQSPTIILVTHHIEEIGPWISHVHVLKSGRTLRAGTAPGTLTAAVLSDAFSRPCAIEGVPERPRPRFL